MRLSDLLSSQRIILEPQMGTRWDSDAVLGELSRLLCEDGFCQQEDVLVRLREREKLQSTGIGDGVAIPHAAVEAAPVQRAALVLCPQGVDFDSIDAQPTFIFFAVIGPKSEASTHLKILATISRLLRSPETRRRLLESASSAMVYSLVEEHDSLEAPSNL